METKTWMVEISIGEHEGQTRAEARLTSEPRTMTGWGIARLNPTDRDVPMIGDELAAARALADLSHQLLDTAAADIGDATHERVHLYR